MVIGSVLVVFTDPVLSQKIANSRDRAGIEREKVRTAVLSRKSSAQVAAYRSQYSLGCPEANGHRSQEVLPIRRGTGHSA